MCKIEKEKKGQKDDSCECDPSANQENRMEDAVSEKDVEAANDLINPDPISMESRG